jgi:hypothetical protein
MPVFDGFEFHVIGEEVLRGVETSWPPGAVRSGSINDLEFPE